MRVGLLGAAGYTGRLVAAELDRRGIPFLAAGRDTAEVAGALAGVAALDGVRHVDGADGDGVERLVDEVNVLCSTAGPFDGTAGRATLSRTIDAGRHYVDVSLEQRFLQWAIAQDDTARASGATAVPGAGFLFLVGDLLAHLAGEALRVPREIHVAYAVPSRRSPLRVASRGTCATVATLLGRPGLALDHGAPVEEWPGEARRLAWFPRPVGPRHAAGVPGGEPLTVPRHLTGVETVRTSLATSTMRAEWLQLVAGAARWGAARRLLTALVSRRGPDPDAGARAATRWAVVAEARDDAGTVARAWAYGHDPYGLAAAAAVAMAAHLGAGAAPRAGVLAPAESAGAAGFLDALAARTDLRWSVRRPDA